MGSFTVRRSSVNQQVTVIESVIAKRTVFSYHTVHIQRSEVVKVLVLWLIKLYLILLTYMLNWEETDADYNVYCFEDLSGCQIENDNSPFYEPIFVITVDNGD
jgi:hypothetical protein